MPAMSLSSRGLLALSGAQARSFLNGLITVDTLKLSLDAPRYAALLSPQGKFLHDFFVSIDGQGRILLETESARLLQLKQRLLLYRLRAPVDIDALPPEECHVIAGWGESAPPEAFVDPRLSALGWRAYSRKALPEGEALYHAHRVALGVAEAGDLQPDKSLILEYGFDLLHAVDFDKGCYVGQEVTARMRHRATMRKYLHQISVQGGATLPAVATPIEQEGREVGALRSVCGTNGLALLSFDAAEKARTGEASLTCGGVTLAASLPAWAEKQKNWESAG